jgi:predicted KAP-like P-loop ATPase
MLAGEVQTYDQILVEGLRILFPELYSFIRDNGNTFTEDVLDPLDDSRFAARRVTDLKRDLKELVKQVMVSADRSEHEAGEKIISEIFIGSNRGKRPSLSRYFDRYFSYSIAPDDISGQELEEILRLAEDDDETGLGTFITELADRSAPALLRAVRTFVGNQGRDVTERVARAVSFRQIFIPRGSEIFTHRYASRVSKL